MRLGLVVVLAAVAWGAWTGWQIDRFGRAAALDEPAVADAAVVLGAAVRGEAPSPVFAARLDHGIDRVRTGVVQHLLLTGGTRDPVVPAEADVGRRYALAQGVSPERVHSERRSRTTEQNLACLRPLADSLGVRSVRLVSDPLHLRRATTIARDLGFESIPDPTPTTRYRSWRTKGPFLAREVWFTGVDALARLVGHEPACPA